ncbi:MAG: cytosine permease [Eubacteriales bacterium]|nr:cytosine permease [Eubacteriales bacterium]
MSTYTQVELNGLYELTEEARAELTGSKYYNKDLEPSSISQRTWTTYNITALWIGMCICIPSLSLASAAIALGLSPWLAVFNVILGNLIILVPMQLNSHAGTKYGIPFPIFARLTFGAIGAHVPSVLRGLVACGWTSVQAWVGGGAVAALLGILIPFFSDPTITIGLPGNPAVVVGQVIGFFLFMLFVLWVAYNGFENIKWVQNIGSPILVIVIVLLFAWSVAQVHGAGIGAFEVMSQPNDWAALEANGGMFYVFAACLTSNIAFWATMALNIPDFSRYAKSQRVQFRGQLYGMPIPMFIMAFIGAYFAQATKLTMGEAMFDPTNVFYHVDNAFVIFVCAIGVILATITTCVAANVVAPANGFSNLSPGRISYKKGVVITCIIACFVMQPWWIYGSGAAYIFTWLNNYGIVLAPVAAIFVADYYICKKRRMDVASLYAGDQGRYWYKGGVNWAAVIAWVAAFILPLLGNTVFLYDGGTPNLLDNISANGYIFSFIVGIIVYMVFMKLPSFALNSNITEEEEIAMTRR